MSRLLLVDRIEPGQIVCETETRERVVIPLAAAPEGVREGDCLRERDGGLVIDRDETARRRARNAALFRRLIADEDA